MTISRWHVVCFFDQRPYKDLFATLKQHYVENGILCDLAPPSVSECNIGATYKHKTRHVNMLLVENLYFEVNMYVML